MIEKEEKSNSVSEKTQQKKSKEKKQEKTTAEPDFRIKSQRKSLRKRGEEEIHISLGEGWDVVR